MSQDLRGRRVLVTGAGGGIGRALVPVLARAGATLVVVGRRIEALEEVTAGLEGGPHLALPFDVSDPDAWDRARHRIAPDGALHGVVAAAAVLTPVGPVGTWDTAEFRRTLDVNVMGSLLTVTSNLEALRAAGGASVVMFSGGGATAPLPRFDAYAASKAAVVRLAENLAVELAPVDVRVNSVAPGFVVTPMHEATIAAGPELAGSEYWERTRRAVEDGGGDSPADAAELTSFLLSGSSAGITGKLISARWDPWRDEAFRARLRTEDSLATLRRIDDQFFTPAVHEDS